MKNDASMLIKNLRLKKNFFHGSYDENLCTENESIKMKITSHETQKIGLFFVRCPFSYKFTDTMHRSLSRTVKIEARLLT
jgi:hypothetical protein